MGEGDARPRAAHRLTYQTYIPAAILAPFGAAGKMARRPRGGAGRRPGRPAPPGQRICSITEGSQVTSTGNAITTPSVTSCRMMNGTTPAYMWRMVIDTGATARR